MHFGFKRNSIIVTNTNV